MSDATTSPIGTIQPAEKSTLISEPTTTASSTPTHSAEPMTKTPNEESRRNLKSGIYSGRTKYIVIAVVIVAALAGGFSILRSRVFSAVLPKANGVVDEIVIEPRSMSFWVDATGTLRASSVRNFSAPPPFGEYWQFQIVSLAPEGNNVKNGDLLINFDAQKVREDLQRFQRRS